MAYSLTSHTGEHSPYAGKMLQSKFRKAFWKRRHFSGAEKAGYVVFSWTGRKEFLTKGKAKMKATQTSGRLVTQKQMYLRRSFRVSLYNERIILCNFMIQNFNSNTINWFFFFLIPMGASIPKQSSGNYKDMSNIWGKSTRKASPFWLSCAGPAPRPQHEHTRESKGASAGRSSPSDQLDNVH